MSNQMCWNWTVYYGIICFRYMQLPIPGSKLEIQIYMRPQKDKHKGKSNEKV